MNKELSVVAIIPARYRSTRFPGKPLALLAGRPMIQHVYQRVQEAALVSRVIVATDDERIRRAVSAFGGQAKLTSPGHLCGTDRVAEVAAGLDAQVVVNVQGDEPLISPGAIDQAIAPLLEDASLKMVTLAHQLEGPGQLADPDVVKVAVDQEGFAVDFFRRPESAPSSLKGEWRVLKHVGLYAYRRDYLLELAGMEPTDGEQHQHLEQLRALERGGRIKVVETMYRSQGVDRPEDLERAEKMLAALKEASS